MKKFIPILFVLLACQKQGTAPNAEIQEKVFIEGDTGWCEVIYTGNRPVSTEAVGDYVFYMDFDGFDLPANSIWGNTSAITCAPSGLTEAAKQEIVQRVIDDYDLFGMRVTSEESYWSAADVDKRIRLVITPTTSVWSGNRAGIASSNILGSSLNNTNPAGFIFPNRLGNNTTKVAETISHEGGHAIAGLSHQSRYTGCTRIEEYHTGFTHPSDATQSFRLIMGDAVNSTGVSNWYTGPDQFSCTSIQNDVQMIINRVGSKPDEASSDFSNPKTFWFSNFITQMSGTLTPNDEDMWLIGKTCYLDVSSLLYDNNTGANWSYGNIDLRVDLYNTNQQLVATWDDPAFLNIFNFYAPIGYYVKVSGSGSNPAMPRQFMTGKYLLQTTSGIIDP